MSVKFVKDPDGVVHRADPYPHVDYGWQTVCGQDIRFTAKWVSLFASLAKPTCLGCLAQ